MLLTSLPEVQSWRSLSRQYRRSAVTKRAYYQWRYDYYKACRRINASIWNDARVSQAVEGVRYRLRKIRGLLPLRLDDTRSTFTDLNKSAGYNKSGAKTKGDIKLAEIREVAKRLREGDLCEEYHSNVGFRSHLVKRNAPDKTRVILVTAGPIVFVEKMFAHPFSEALVQHPYTVWATGFKWDRHGGQLIDHYFKDPSRACSIDFSKFDLSCPNWLKRQIFALIKETFEMEEHEEAIFDSIVETHCDTTVKYGAEQLRMTHGVRSGSAFTHVMGTLISMFLMEYCGVENYICYGDDCIAEADLKWLRFVTNSTSYVIHPTKSKMGELHWLGLKRKGQRWVMEDPDARVAKLFLPEPGKRPYDLATRMQASVLNAGRDPLAGVMLDVLERSGNHALSPTLREELHYWGRTYTEVPFTTIRELYDYMHAEFL
uniref:RdRp n=1 Tax=Beihai partiti-like virus 10 TaxID=1922502 RepID=A0A1L3KLT7_9VIRU|nr:RdRp [Beihai partiti-like virus 10]